MTEADWLASVVPILPLDDLPSPPSERKLRLFAVACCRQVWDGLPSDASRQATLLAELCADSPAAVVGLSDARAAAVAELELHPGEPVYDAGYWACGVEMDRDAFTAAGYAARYGIFARTPAGQEIDWSRSVEVAAVEEREQAAVLRCIFGNPFRPVAVDPEWRTPTVVALAEGVYADRRFDRLPILADALDDAGCDQPDLIGHLRGPGPHARGCWVVDLILGKS